MCNQNRSFTSNFPKKNGASYWWKKSIVLGESKPPNLPPPCSLFFLYLLCLYCFAQPCVQHTATMSELKKEKKKKRKSSVGSAAPASAAPTTDDDFVIKPEDTTPKLDTSKWPLLLKNYDQVYFSLSTAPTMSIICFCICVAMPLLWLIMTHVSFFYVVTAARSHRTLHSLSQWTQPPEAPAGRVHSLRNHQSGQTCKPLFARDRCLGSSYSPL